METEKTTDIKVPILNHDCLEHLFQFVAPKDWPAFLQVCKSWKLAANIRFLKLSFFDIHQEELSHGPRREILSFVEFKNILKLIAAQLRYAKLQISERHGHAFVRFGHFEYNIEGYIGTREIDEFMNIIAKETENIKTLKIDSFDGVTREDWDNFFRVNLVTTFKFTIRNEDDRNSFLKTYTPILPNSLERVCIEGRLTTFRIYDDTERIAERTALLQFLDRLPRITKLKLKQGFIPPSIFARILSKHASCITELCLEGFNRGFNHESKDDASTILSLIPNCTSLTYLKLMGNFKLQDDLCTRIAENCQLIRRLTLLPYNKFIRGCVVKEKSLTTLLSLPNLEELGTYSPKITLNTEAKKLKKLFLYCGGMLFVDLDNLADALALMPCLSSLTLYGLDDPMKKYADRRLKRTILSRGQNINIYT